MSKAKIKYESGFQSCHYPVPEHLSKLSEIFEKHTDAIKTAKKDFMEEISAHALTLSPKDAFEA
jgi:hypothetical protein